MVACVFPTRGCGGRSRIGSLAALHPGLVLRLHLDAVVLHEVYDVEVVDRDNEVERIRLLLLLLEVQLPLVLNVLESLHVVARVRPLDRSGFAALARFRLNFLEVLVLHLLELALDRQKLAIVDTARDLQ